MHSTQQALLEAIRKNPASSLRDLQKACGINNISVADYHLARLIAAGKIRRVTQKWEIVERD